MRSFFYFAYYEIEKLQKFFLQTQTKEFNSIPGGPHFFKTSKSTIKCDFVTYMNTLKPFSSTSLLLHFGMWQNILLFFFLFSFYFLCCALNLNLTVKALQTLLLDTRTWIFIRSGRKKARNKFEFPRVGSTLWDLKYLADFIVLYWNVEWNVLSGISYAKWFIFRCVFYLNIAGFQD